MSVASNLQFWTKLHRWLGLGSMAFLAIAAITGCILCVDKTIDKALNPDLFHTTATATPLDAVTAVERFAAAHPTLQVTSFPLAVTPGDTIQLIVMPKAGATDPGFNQAFIDPADGRLVATRLGGPGWDRQHIVEGIFEFHYTLLAGNYGRWLMGIVAFGWLIGNGIGFYLTLPSKGPMWKKWKRAWKIDWRARLRWVMLDLHRASGLWLFLGVMVLAFTSVSMNFYEEAFSPIVSAASPAAPSPFDKPAATPPGADRLGFRKALDLSREAAAQRQLAWQPASLSYIPNLNLYGATFTASGRVAYRGLGPITLYVDGAKGAMTYADDPYSDSAGRKISRSLYPLHSGEVIGPVGTAIIFLLGLATTEMCVSGFYIWWKKRSSRLKTSRAKQPAAKPA